MNIPNHYIIERKPILHARINVNENQVVRLIIPNNFSDDEIERLVIQKTKWINDQLESFHSEAKLKIVLSESEILFLGKSHPMPGGDLDKWYKEQAKKYITNRVNQLATEHKFQFNKLFIRNVASKWGNCSKENNLSFNWRLIKAPEKVIDYVILHELCHTVILNHTQAFWLKLSTVCSTFKEQADWLKKYGKSLFENDNLNATQPPKE